MAERLYRTQILLEPEQYRALAAIAQGEKRSISAVVREMIQERLDRRKTFENAAARQRLEALERIREHREAILVERGGQPIELDVVGLINQMREERDEHSLAIIQHRD
jgi:hypothetical protein